MAASKERNRVYQNEWYHANKESALATRKRRRDRINDEYRAYKLTRSCEHCPESHPACIEFHHPDPNEKDVNPSDLFRVKGWGWEKIKAELDKLTALCANCHRKEHARLREDGSDGKI